MAQQHLSAHNRPANSTTQAQPRANLARAGPTSLLFHIFAQDHRPTACLPSQLVSMPTRGPRSPSAMHVPVHHAQCMAMQQAAHCLSPARQSPCARLGHPPALVCMASSPGCLASPCPRPLQHLPNKRQPVPRARLASRPPLSAVATCTPARQSRFCHRQPQQPTPALFGSSNNLSHSPCMTCKQLASACMPTPAAKHHGHSAIAKDQHTSKLHDLPSQNRHATIITAMLQLIFTRQVHHVAVLFPMHSPRFSTDFGRHATENVCRERRAILAL